MTGKPENNRCPLCGGRLNPELATVPFLLSDATVLIKNVPAMVCSSCHEPYATGEVADHIVSLLNSLRGIRAEVLILPYSELQPVPPFASVTKAQTQSIEPHLE